MGPCRDWVAEQRSPSTVGVASRVSSGERVTNCSRKSRPELNAVGGADQERDRNPLHANEPRHHSLETSEAKGISTAGEEFHHGMDAFKVLVNEIGVPDPPTGLFSTSSRTTISASASERRVGVAVDQLEPTKCG